MDYTEYGLRMSDIQHIITYLAYVNASDKIMYDQRNEVRNTNRNALIICNDLEKTGFDTFEEFAIEKKKNHEFYIDENSEYFTFALYHVGTNFYSNGETKIYPREKELAKLDELMSAELKEFIKLQEEYYKGSDPEVEKAYFERLEQFKFDYLEQFKDAQ